MLEDADFLFGRPGPEIDVRRAVNEAKKLSSEKTTQADGRQPFTVEAVHTGRAGAAPGREREAEQESAE